MIFERLDQGYQKGTIDQALEIELNKKMSKAMAEIRREIKSGQCFYCGKSVDSYCNSHNIPRFCLKNIGSDGEVVGPNAILGLPKMGVSIGKETLGINEAGTFSLICRECDSVIFQDYENPSNYELDKKPSQKMLAQIALKNYLKFIHKRKLEIALLEHSIKQIPNNDLFYALTLEEFARRLEVSKLDLITYTLDYEKAKKTVESGKGPGYYMFYYRKLDYVTPIAIQAPITVSIDLNGNIVNDVFNSSKSFHPSDLHLCVLPLERETAIILFVENKDIRYRKFRKQFEKLDEESKLGLINYLIFLYTEDYFMAKELQDKIDLQILNEVVNRTPVIWSLSPIKDTKMLGEKFNLINWPSIPNLLSEEYKLR